MLPHGRVAQDLLSEATLDGSGGPKDVRLRDCTAPVAVQTRADLLPEKPGLWDQGSHPLYRALALHGIAEVARTAGPWDEAWDAVVTHSRIHEPARRPKAGTVEQSP